MKTSDVKSLFTKSFQMCVYVRAGACVHVCVRTW